MSSTPQPTSVFLRAMVVIGIVGTISLAIALRFRSVEQAVESNSTPGATSGPVISSPRVFVDSSGFSTTLSVIPAWSEDVTPDELRKVWTKAGYRQIESIDAQIRKQRLPTLDVSNLLISKAMLLNYEGDSHAAYDVLSEARNSFQQQPLLASQYMGTLVYLQGVTALRCGETDNCIQCRGESSCILPISAAAVHQNEEGSRRAIARFSEYLTSFPDDLEVRWLLNLAHMTLGEYPDRVDPRYLIQLDRYVESEMDIGQFRDIGHAVGLDRFNTAGGGIMDDFDSDGLLDVVVTASEPTENMGIYRNTGDGTFREVTKGSGCEKQFSGLYCVQADYDNDGHLDVFVPRGAWLDYPMKPSLLRNDGNMQFTDVTQSAGLDAAANSNCAAWADFDNDGDLDLFMGCERQPSRMYRNLGNGTFADVAQEVGIKEESQPMTKGCAWIDFDNDDDEDLFTTSLSGVAKLYRNEGGDSFTDVSQEMGIDGPTQGFACWAWDYDNDGWLDLFATSYDHTLEGVVKGLIGEPHNLHSNRLFHNEQGMGFKDVTVESGLDLVFATMGCNYGDLDNDGYLDMYLGTGNPLIGMLVPNRMFKNVNGSRFSEITGSSRTGHLQKGHSVACGDWDRDGNLDVFMQMGGSVPGDRYHNILFQNPGHEHEWLTVKLVGRETNRSAIGARISITTKGPTPLTIHRHVSTGSSFGANPLEQTIGLGSATGIEKLEVHWPTSKQTQVFRDIAVNQMILVMEGDEQIRLLDRHPITYTVKTETASR
ncbi:MAG: CRTAC1 family protein [Planctomycetaceae bacterium]|nr:CRTAC1 family protein [Planctomycetaceae bacterium]MCB9951480.1 CRTAC1 family protein [Planctomycetaceae bacterium]